MVCCAAHSAAVLHCQGQGGEEGEGEEDAHFPHLLRLSGGWMPLRPSTVLYSETQSPAANQTDLNTRFPKGRCAILPTVGRKIALTKQVWLYLLAADIGRSPLEPHACYWRVDSLGDRFWLAGWPGGDGKYLSERALQSKYAMTN